ncbi:SDR family NAD(P)-dependent oxidoreductase [Dysgonomonas macrotermitis]|uniref:Short-chain dehydrogenase n=1 Tax=Dysgonomonas macrotermitis TaxID=1346286 RepID=A0A1M5BSF1_9BACT|nr:SDR family NAD(P)-dependent oxidoreductase [Dysgonomonas macrotermitis]SHF45330.1 Short-chain dehydrogenase [Dysgonomonas macrotermitis]
MENIKGKTIWITGASSGLGEALAAALARRGAKIILSGRNAEALSRVQVSVGESKVIVMDMEKPDTFEDKTREAISAFGQIDILIHNAGIAQNSPAQKTHPEIERKIMQIDYFAPTELTRCVVPHFMERKSGRIVVISGLLAYVNLPGRSSYSAAKAALVGYFGCLRAELQNYNIGVSVIVPGSLQTDLVNKALSGDGSVTDKKRAIGGFPLIKAADQIVKVIRTGKNQSYIGGKKEFYMWKLSGLYPDFMIKKILKMSSQR